VKTFPFHYSFQSSNLKVGFCKYRGLLVNAVSFKEHRNIIYNTNVRFLYFPNYCCLLFSLTATLLTTAALLLIKIFLTIYKIF